MLNIFAHEKSLTARTMECKKPFPGQLWRSQHMYYFWQKSKTGHGNLSLYNFHLPFDTSCHYHNIFTSMYHNLLSFHLSAYNLLLKMLLLFCSLFLKSFLCVCFIAGIHFLDLFKFLNGKLERNTVKAKQASCLW